MARMSSRNTMAAMLPTTRPRRRRIRAIQRSALDGKAKRRGGVPMVEGLRSAGWSAIEPMISRK